MGRSGSASGEHELPERAAGGPGDPAPGEAGEPEPAGPSSEDEPSRLARAFQAGDRSVLVALHQALRPIMASAFARYRARPGALPAALEQGDLSQQGWVILAELGERWRPEGGSFGAYFRVCFPWALARYVRRSRPGRGAGGMRELGAERPDVRDELAARPDADGREWDGELAWLELLERLGEDEREALRLRLSQRATFSAVARALRLTRPAAFRLYRRALKRALADEE